MESQGLGVLPYGLSEPRIPNLQKEGVRCGTFCEPPLGLADRGLRPPAPGPPLTTPEPRVTPRSVTHGAPGPHTPHAPTSDGCAGWLRDRDAGDPEDVGPTVRHGQGRRRELFHPATSGSHHTRPVGRLPKPASNSASQSESATAWSRETSPRRSHVRPEAPLSVGPLSRAPGPPRGPGPDAPEAASREPLTSRRGARGRSVRKAQARERRGGASQWAGELGHAPTRPVPASQGVASAQVRTNAGENF